MLARVVAIISSALVLVCAAGAQISEAKLSIFRAGKYDDKGNLQVSDPGTDILYKGTERNVFLKVSLARPAAIAMAFKVLVTKDRTYADDWKGRVGKGETEVVTALTLGVGEYVAAIVDPENDDKVYTQINISVTDNIGDRASGNQKAGLAKLTICESVDDDWKAVGARWNEKEKVFEWTAGKNFNVLIKNNGKPFGIDFLGIIIHNQGDDGKDVGFVDEFQSDPLDSEKSTMWATVEGIPQKDWIKPGRYTIYIIDWSKRQLNDHTGNLKEYFAKVTLVVK